MSSGSDEHINTPLDIEIDDEDEVVSVSSEEDFLQRLKNQKVNEMRKMLTEMRTTMSSKLYLDQMRQVISFYNSNKHFIYHGDIVHQALVHDLPFQCFRRRIMDTSVVIKVLRCIAELDCTRCGGIPNFFEKAVRVCDRYDSLWIPENGLNSQLYTYLSYYLHHVSEAGLVFSGQQVSELLSEACSPWEMTTQPNSWKDQTLMTMLQYGAWNFDESMCRTVKVQSLYARCFMNLFNMITARHMGNGLRETVIMSKASKDVQTSVHRIRLLMRALSNPHLLTFRICGKFGLPEISVMVPFYRNIFPDMDLGVLRTSSLRHWTKCKIRENLCRNGQLPRGISRLELPNAIQSYLNLYTD